MSQVIKLEYDLSHPVYAEVKRIILECVLSWLQPDKDPVTYPLKSPLPSPSLTPTSPHLPKSSSFLPSGSDLICEMWFTSRDNVNLLCEICRQSFLMSPAEAGLIRRVIELYWSWVSASGEKPLFMTQPATTSTAPSAGEGQSAAGSAHLSVPLESRERQTHILIISTYSAYLKKLYKAHNYLILCSRHCINVLGRLSFPLHLSPISPLLSLFSSLSFFSLPSPLTSHLSSTLSPPSHLSPLPSLPPSHTVRPSSPCSILPWEVLIRYEGHDASNVCAGLQPTLRMVISHMSQVFLVEERNETRSSQMELCRRVVRFYQELVMLWTLDHDSWYMNNVQMYIHTRTCTRIHVHTRTMYIHACTRIHT